VGCGGFGLSNQSICRYREAMRNRRNTLRNAVLTLAGALLLAGCNFSLGGLPASEPNVEPTATVRDEESGLLTGLFTRTPRDLPDAVPLPVREATFERAYGGAILRVTGVAPTQGYFNAALVAENEGAVDAGGAMTVTFLAVPPETPEDVGPERTRLLMSGAYLSDLELRSVRAIRLVAGSQVMTLPTPPRPPAPPPPPIEELTVEAIETGAF
jgi:hypothetical protein